MIIINKLISVIVPVYNVERYLERCIESILNQSYRYIELILVDDGSTDESGAICDEYLNKENCGIRIKVIHKKNGGLSDARNTGKRYATGDYLCFIDSDDWVDRYIFEKAINTVEEYGSKIVVWSYSADYVNENDFVFTSERHVLQDYILSSDREYFYLLNNNVLKDHIGYAWNKLYDKEIVCDIDFDKGISLVEDILFNSKAFCKVHDENGNISFISYIGSHYIQRKRVTLGNRYYKDYIELKIKANWAMKAILIKYGTPKKAVFSFLLPLYFDAITGNIKKTLKTCIKKILGHISEKNSAIVTYLCKRSIHYQYVIKNNIESNKIFVFMAGFYPNLGDQAITHAQINYVKRLFPLHDIIILSSAETYSAALYFKHRVKNTDIITIIGGGNMGDDYLSLESCRRFIVNCFPHNKIISFPQTIIYQKSKELKKSVRIYTGHKNITIFAREKDSYMRAKDYFSSCDVRLCPDIVLSLDYRDANCKKRNDVLLCKRADRESATTDKFSIYLTRAIKNSFSNVMIRDTVDISVSDSTSDRYYFSFMDFLEQIKCSRVIVTDRLHCMIFCVITGTPCVAIDNNNGKLSSTYSTWLSELDYIRMVTYKRDNWESVISDIINLCKTFAESNRIYEKPLFLDKFITLKDALLSNKSN